MLSGIYDNNYNNILVFEGSMPLCKRLGELFLLCISTVFIPANPLQIICMHACGYKYPHFVYVIFLIQLPMNSELIYDFS